ncbi:MAG: glycosyltransferase [Propionibacteriaceae bacterium]|nr:glycosyltransferase [Propionibacteriaceae bacterium]
MTDHHGHHDTEGAAPAITVLVPIFNVERYLDQCLASIQKQTFTDLEVICINDGSTDSSREIIESYVSTDDRFTVIDKANSGYGDSMNQGLARARGTYIGIVESDDFVDENMFAILHETITAHDVQMVKSNFLNHWSTPYPTDQFIEVYPASLCDRVVNPQTEQDMFYLKPCIWTALYSREFLVDNEIDFLPTPGASYQDLGFSTKVWISAERVFFLHPAYLHYRQDNEASSVKNPEKVYCVCDEYDEIERYLSERPERAVYLRKVLTKMKYDSYQWNYDRIADQYRLDFLQRMRTDFLADKAAGHLDWELFEPWKKSDLTMILESPELFHASRNNRRGHSVVAKAAYYLKSGGVTMLARMVRRKFFGRS